MYEKKAYMPYYLQYKRGGARKFAADQWYVQEEEDRSKRAGARTFPVFIDESTEIKRMGR
jgi:hypothetical protein